MTELYLLSNQSCLSPLGRPPDYVRPPLTARIPTIVTHLQGELGSSVGLREAWKVLVLCFWVLLQQPRTA